METIIDEIAAELMDATRNYRPFSSEHEGLAVIREKYTNLEKEIFDSERFGARKRMRDDALQLAAMAAKLVKFIDDNPRDEKKGRLLFQPTSGKMGDAT